MSILNKLSAFLSWKSVIFAICTQSSRLKAVSFGCCLEDDDSVRDACLKDDGFARADYLGDCLGDDGFACDDCLGDSGFACDGIEPRGLCVSSHFTPLLQQRNISFSSSLAISCTPNPLFFFVYLRISFLLYIPCFHIRA